LIIKTQSSKPLCVGYIGGYLTPTHEANWNNLCLPANRPAFIQKIVQYVQANNLDGVDVDLEWQYVETWYSPFVLELKTALGPAQHSTHRCSSWKLPLPANYRFRFSGL
jgi:hypothetical protein